jgi:23S rRNA pseudouridine1911/1915/1917 synthase
MIYKNRKGNNKKIADGKSYPVLEDTELMVFLIATFPGKNRNNIKTLLKNKLVTVDNQIQTQFNLPLRKGQKVEIKPKKDSALQTSYSGLEILHEDRDLIIINKDTNLLTMGTNKEKQRTAYSMLSAHVKKADPKNKIYIVHRLDRQTSGLLVFAKNEHIKNQLQENWNNTIIERTYIGIVEGRFSEKKGTYKSYLFENPKSLIVHSSQNPEKGNESITHYEVLDEKRGFSLLKLNLETGRKNQIRVHMQDLKCPIVGDKKYGATTNPIRRLGLHAKVLAFIHPKTGKLVRFESDIPKEFKNLFGKLNA